MAENEVSLFNSSVSTVEGNLSINNQTEKISNTEEILLARLNELRQWQESQRKSLVESQLNQTKQLELEKQKLYALLGLSASNSDLEVTGVCSTESSYFIPNVKRPIEISPKQTIHINNSSIDEKPLEIHSPSINQLNKIIKNMAIRSPRRDKTSDESNIDIPKRPFLKRGEGLIQRFKMSPDAFRLDNLPKYKYAQRIQKHAQTMKSRKQRHHLENTTIDTLASTAGVQVGVTSEGHQNNAKGKCTQSKKRSENNTETSQNSRRTIQKRPSPQQLKLKSNTLQQFQPNKFNARTNDVNQFSHQHHRDVLENEKVEQATSPRINANLSSPATKILLDTPTRERLQFQQDEINDLKYFVQLEENFNQNNCENMKFTQI